MILNLGCIVEGHGEVAAVPVLLRRLQHEYAPSLATVSCRSLQAREARRTVAHRRAGRPRARTPASDPGSDRRRGRLPQGACPRTTSSRSAGSARYPLGRCAREARVRGVVPGGDRVARRPPRIGRQPAPRARSGSSRWCEGVPHPQHARQPGLFGDIGPTGAGSTVRPPVGPPAIRFLRQVLPGSGASVSRGFAAGIRAAGYAIRLTSPCRRSRIKRVAVRGRVAPGVSWN